MPEAKHPHDAPNGAISWIGCVLDGRYRIDAVLGEGGLGQVFRATDGRLGRPVAIKVMHAHHVARAELRARFEREARSLATLSHPNVVGVVDYGVDGDVPFLVMELLEGRTLETALAEGLPIARVIPIVRDVLRAVAYAHAQGLVHRDLKPANVFLQRVPAIGDVVRVLDFGLAKFVEENEGAPTLTRAGAVLGTPAYMSPEQATGGQVDARADVYALGIVLYELVTGERPFQAPAGPELLRQHLLMEMPSITGERAGRRIRPELDALVRRAAAKSRAERFADGAEMAAALDALPADALAAIGDDPAARVTQSPRSPTPELDATVASSPEAGATLAARQRAVEPVAATNLAIPIASIAVPPPSEIVSAPARETHEHGGQAAPPRRGRTRIWIPIAAVCVLGSIAIAITFAFGPGSDTTPDIAPVAAPPQTAALPTSPTTPSKRLTNPPPAPHVAAPFDAPTPPQLVSIETRIRAGHEITSDQRRTLFRYSTNHPHDPRGWLLMGHADFSVGARTDACGRYEHAFRADDAAREDPTMRHDLLVMVGHHAVTREATRLVIEIYGARALTDLPAIETELAGDRDAIRRLRALRRRLEDPQAAAD